MADSNCRLDPRPHYCSRELRRHRDSLIGYFEPRRFRRGTIYIKRLPRDIGSFPRALKQTREHDSTTRATEKLATSRAQAKRFLRSVISHNHSTPTDSSDRAHSPDSTHSGESVRNRRESPPDYDTGHLAIPDDNMRAGLRGSISGPVRPSLSDELHGNRSRGGSEVSLRSSGGTAVMPGTDPNDKPLATGSGVSLSINLAEPVLFLQGFDQSDASQGNTAMLRGTLHLRVTKSAKIKAVTLKFKGRAVTKWPEGTTRRVLLSR